MIGAGEDGVRKVINKTKESLFLTVGHATLSLLLGIWADFAYAMGLGGTINTVLMWNMYEL